MATTRLGKLLKDRRRELRLTLAQLGAALGLADRVVKGRVELGERMPSDERLLELAKVLRLDGRELLAAKFRDVRSHAVARTLLEPPAAELPRLRRLLLATCANPAVMRPELERGERTAVERIVFQTLLDYALLPALQADRHAPKRLRERVQKALRRGQDLDPWWFEEEAEEFLPWARERFASWWLDLPTLVVHVRHSDAEGDVSTVSLVDRELRERMVERLDAAPGSLEDALRAEGLGEDDVEEIVALVAFKKARAHRAS